MQRLFSSFADGWPGAGLLLLRVLAGSGLLHDGFCQAGPRLVLSQMVLSIVAAAFGAMLVGGLVHAICGDCGGRG